VTAKPMDDAPSSSQCDYRLAEIMLDGLLHDYSQVEGWDLALNDEGNWLATVRFHDLELYPPIEVGSHCYPDFAAESAIRATIHRLGV